MSGCQELKTWRVAFWLYNSMVPKHRAVNRFSVTKIRVSGLPVPLRGDFYVWGVRGYLQGRQAGP